MLEHTLSRVEMLIPRQRIMVVVTDEHRPEIEQQLSHWPGENVIVQPENRDTTAGILLPLVHIASQDPAATVAIFPSDHFIANEQRFIDYVRYAVSETYWFPESFILLGMTPSRIENGYSWIESVGAEYNHFPRATRAVTHLWDKPPLYKEEILGRQGALWNSFVYVTKCHRLWDMVREAVPDVYLHFLRIYRALGSPEMHHITRRIYRHLRAVNFSAGVCEPWAPALRVLPVPDVGWSDWGSVERIVATVEQLGQQPELISRLQRLHYKLTPVLLGGVV
jgi:mannose-1-phosphate guanylyltransferase